MTVCNCTLPTIHGIEICNGCSNNRNIGFSEFTPYTIPNYKDWCQEPPTENISFFEAFRFMQKGYKITRSSWKFCNGREINWLFLSEDRCMFWSEEESEFFNRFTFSYEDICAKDWMVEKIE